MSRARAGVFAANQAGNSGARRVEHLEAAVAINRGFSSERNAVVGICSAGNAVVDFEDVAGLHAADNAGVFYREDFAVKAEDIIGTLTGSKRNFSCVVIAVKFVNEEINFRGGNVVGELAFIVVARTLRVARHAGHALALIDVITYATAEGANAAVGIVRDEQIAGLKREVFETAGKRKNRAFSLNAGECRRIDGDVVARAVRAHAFDFEVRTNAGCVERIELNSTVDTCEREC